MSYWWHCLPLPVITKPCLTQRLNISLPKNQIFLVKNRAKEDKKKKRGGGVDGGSTYLIRPRLVAWFSLGPSLILIWPTPRPFRPLGTKASACFHGCFNSSRKSFERWKKLPIFSPVVLSCVPVTSLAKPAPSQTKCFPNLYSMPLKIAVKYFLMLASIASK